MEGEKEIYELPSAHIPRVAGRSASTEADAGTYAGTLWRASYPTAGVPAVLSRMADLATAGALDRDVRGLALDATQGLDEDPRTGQPDRTQRHDVARAIYRLVVENVDYVLDAHSVEQLQSPHLTLETRAGDCDDIAMLCAALLSSLGVPARFRAIGTDASAPDAYTHVYAEYKAGGGWHSCDTVGDPGLGAQIAPGRVTTELTWPLHAEADGGAPAELAVLAGLGESGGTSTTRGPISGPNAWVQITERSHDGRVPGGDSFWIDVYAERSYELFGDCAMRLVATDAETGEEITSSTFYLSKWTGITTCEGRGRLTFPQGFSPTETQIVLEAFDTDYFHNQSLGASEAFHLTSADVSERGGNGVEEVTTLLDKGMTVALVFSGGLALAAAWPYAQSFFDRD